MPPLIARMRLHDFAGPFRIEQVGEAFRRVFRLHQIGIVGNRHQGEAHAGKGAIGIALVRRPFQQFGRNIGFENALLLPGHEQGLVGAVEHVDRKDLVGAFLRHALVDALAAGAFDLHRDAGIFFLEILGEVLRDFDIDCGVIDNLAFLGRRLDQLRRDRLRRRRRGESRTQQQSTRARRDGSAHRPIDLHDVLPDPCRRGAHPAARRLIGAHHNKPNSPKRKAPVALSAGHPACGKAPPTCSSGAKPPLVWRDAEI